MPACLRLESVRSRWYAWCLILSKASRSNFRTTWSMLRLLAVWGLSLTPYERCAKERDLCRLHDPQSLVPFTPIAVFVSGVGCQPNRPFWVTLLIVHSSRGYSDPDAFERAQYIRAVARLPKPGSADAPEQRPRTPWVNVRKWSSQSLWTQILPSGPNNFLIQSSAVWPLAHLPHSVEPREYRRVAWASWDPFVTAVSAENRVATLSYREFDVLSPRWRVGFGTNCGSFWRCPRSPCCERCRVGRGDFRFIALRLRGLSIDSTPHRKVLFGAFWRLCLVPGASPSFQARSTTSYQPRRR